MTADALSSLILFLFIYFTNIFFSNRLHVRPRPRPRSTIAPQWHSQANHFNGYFYYKKTAILKSTMTIQGVF